MKKEFGKWLMDIAKYITTAVLLSTMFGEVSNKWWLLALGILAVTTTLLLGLLFIREKKTK